MSELSQLHEQDIIQTICNLMISVQDHPVTGPEKKILVMKQLKFILASDTFERYAPMIGLLIDYLVRCKVLHRRRTSIFDCF